MDPTRWLRPTPTLGARRTTLVPGRTLSRVAMSFGLTLVIVYTPSCSMGGLGAIVGVGNMGQDALSRLLSRRVYIQVQKAHTLPLTVKVSSSFHLALVIWSGF